MKPLASANLPKIIGLSGRRGSGKDTVANLIKYLTLQQDYPGVWADQSLDFFLSNAHTWVSPYTCRSFAGKLKKFAQELTGHMDVYSQAGKTTFLSEWGMTVGELLQKLGTDAIRDGLHKDAWILACFAGMEEDQKYIITDCRFPNEAEAIRARGGLLLRIEGDPLKQQGDGTRDDSHPSETALDDYPYFDAIIDNSGTLDQLKGHVELLLKHQRQAVQVGAVGAPLTYNEAVYTNNVLTYKRKYPRGAAAPNY
ncbi:deoxynucleotide monophosphate kinase family protein [Hymenobacter metallicola]|uniref:Deoxynucleotide monophosphate kinase n=1 Tax=Hymenobacter metallicola TaxID=2563114 RepID=A0A4Z0QKM9_9BACT|nr:hypothetical protein [Hymenobacter metallicola]TGE29803.1 hypothetical protein E5K02_10190 [Hymenobacter metallicola]